MSWLFPRPRRPDMPAGSMIETPPMISSEEFFRSLSSEHPPRETGSPMAAAQPPDNTLTASQELFRPMTASTPIVPPLGEPVLTDITGFAPDAAPDLIDSPILEAPVLEAPFEGAPTVPEAAVPEEVADETVPKALEPQPERIRVDNILANGSTVEAPPASPPVSAGTVVDGVTLDDSLALYAVSTTHRTHLAVTRDTRRVVHSADLAGGGLVPLLAVVPKAYGGACFLLVVDGEIDSFGIEGDPVQGPVVSLRIAAAGIEQLVTLRRPLATEYLSAQAEEPNNRAPIALVDRELSQEERFLLQPVTRASLSPRTAGYLASLRRLCCEPLTGELVLAFLQSDPHAGQLAEAVTRVLPEGEIAWLGLHIEAMQATGRAE